PTPMPRDVARRLAVGRRARSLGPQGKNRADGWRSGGAREAGFTSRRRKGKLAAARFARKKQPWSSRTSARRATRYPLDDRSLADDAAGRAPRRAAPRRGVARSARA